MADAHPAYPRDANDAAPDMVPVRPKVLRRPAHFSASTATPDLTPHLPAIPEPTNATQPPRAWQDDGRFGVTMLLLVVVINLALMFWLPHLRHSITQTAAAPADSIRVVMPPVSRGDKSPVTLYAQPDEDRRIVHMLDLRQLNGVQNSLSVSPKDVPAPVARALPTEDDDTDSQQ